MFQVLLRHSNVKTTLRLYAHQVNSSMFADQHPMMRVMQQGSQTVIEGIRIPKNESTRCPTGEKLSAFHLKLLIKMVGTTGLEPGTSSVSKQPHQQIQQLTSGYGKCQVPASKWKNLGGLRFLGWDLGRTVSVRRDEVGAAASGQSTTGLRRLPLSRSADLCTIENVAANIARSQTLKLLKPQPSPEARCRRKLCAKEPCRHRIPSPFRRGPGVFDASVLYHS